MRRFLPIGNDRYMLSTYTNKPGYTLIPRISQDPNPSHNRTYIDIGVYEYRHRPLQPQVTDGVDIIWVSSKEKRRQRTAVGFRLVAAVDRPAASHRDTALVAQRSP